MNFFRFCSKLWLFFNKGKHTAVNFNAAVILFVLLVTHSIHSQSYSVRTYTVEDGLPTNFVNDVAQDESGRMWFATEVGVSVYDGYSWKNFDEKDGLPNTEYYRLKIDQKNIVWVISSFINGNIAKYEYNKWKISSGFLSKPNSKISVRSFDVSYIDNIPQLCFGTTNGIYLFKNNIWTHLSKEDGLLDNNVYTVKFYQGKFFICTQKGISILEGNKIDNNLNSLIKAPSNQILSIDFENKSTNESIYWLLGKGWIGSLENNKFKLLSPKIPMTFYPSRIQYFLLNDERGRIYYGNELEKLFIEKKTGKLNTLGLDNGFISNGASNIFRDREQNIWFPSPRGIDLVSSLRFQNYFLSNGLLENEVTAILEVEPEKFILGHNLGFTILENEKFKSFSLKNIIKGDPISPRVLDLSKDRTGTVWMALSYLGVGKLKKDGSFEILKHPSNTQFTSVLADPKGNIWVGSNNGLFKIANDKLVLATDVSPYSISLRKLFYNGDGEIIATSTGGLFIFKNNKFKRILSKSDMLNSNFSIHNYSKGKKLIGTVRGLAVLENGTLKPFKENNLEINKKIFFIIQDKEKNYWFGTNDGVVKWDGVESKRYSRENGLSGSETNRAAGIVDSNGRVWIGTDRGLSCYLKEYDYPAPVPVPQLLSIEDHNGKNFSAMSELSFNHDNNTLSFHYRGISFINEKLIRYRVKLEGFDNKWQDAINNVVVRYTNLKPGKYRFSFETKNPMGEWSKTTSSAEITIRGAFYNQWWFYLIVVVLLGLIYFWAYIFLSQKRYNKKLSGEVIIRTKELKESEEKFRTLVQNAPNFICTLNKSGEILFLNKSYPGYYNQNIIKTNIREYIPVERIGEVDQILKKVFEQKIVSNFEINIKNANGNDLWLESTVGPVVTGNHVVEAIAIITNITERKQAELARREIEERQSAILNSMPIVLYTAETPSPYDATWMTDNIQLVTGFSVDLFLNQPYFWSSRVHPQDKDRVEKDFQSLREGKKMVLDYRWKCQDGSYRWFLDSILPKPVVEGKCVEYFGIWLDITEQKLAEERLQKLNETFLRFGVDPIENINRLVELIGNLLNATCAFYNRIIDGKLMALGSWNIPPDFSYTDKPEGHICYDVIKGRIPYPFIIRNLDKTPYALTNTNIPRFQLKTYMGKPINFGGEIVGSLCVFFQKDKESTEEELNLLGIISSAIAVEEKRKNSEELLLKSLREKEILLKEIHHRVKNNLQIVSSLLFLQADKLTDKTNFAIFQESQNRIRSMSLVHEKLYQSTDLSKINFSEYVRSLVIYLFRSYSFAEGTITSRINIGDHFLTIDKAISCGLIINELISNSLKYAFPANIKMERKKEVTIALIKEPGLIFKLLIEDNGIGLPENIDLQNNPTTLGLRLVNMLVLQLDGKIEVDSSNGTKYKIVFSDSNQKI
ncbi:MAG: PAS domain S-box protein [Ignavibacteriales bacterium]|nr:PAS domain S-box protein [Ignavibacteriales bacterium]